MSCHVMSCGVMSFDVMRFLFRVMSGDAKHCDVMSCVLMWWASLLRNDAVRWDAISWACHEMWLLAMSRCFVRSGWVMWWVGRWAGDPNYKELQVLRSTTRYYKLPLRAPRSYKVLLHSTTPVLLCNTKYYSVVQSATPVLLCTTKYYANTTKQYAGTTKYCSVLTWACNFWTCESPKVIRDGHLFRIFTCKVKVLRAAAACNFWTRKL